MKVFKFGGASIKDAESLKNMGKLVKSYDAHPLLIVVSAMGKTTNALEVILEKAWSKADYGHEMEKLYAYHDEIILNAFSFPEPVRGIIEPIFKNLRSGLQDIHRFENFDAAYDSIISTGELLSSAIVYEYLKKSGLAITYLDARDVIRTNRLFRDAGIDWKETLKMINSTLPKILRDNHVITQGFIGMTEQNETTTLGREGSDFTAAIFAHCLNAESATIWKDVPGILNADPKRLSDTILYENLSYQEAAEMTYFGASVIHPKTIKPLANSGIPLYVRSFQEPDKPGTVINEGHPHGLPPTYVFKDNQVLITFRMENLEFINERSLGTIFHMLDKLNIKINMMQNSAVSLTICINQDKHKVKNLIQLLGQSFGIKYNEDLQLITVKNYTQEAIERVSSGKEVLVEQRTRNTYQIVIR